jgi:superfamily II DNA/RNA helicase
VVKALEITQALVFTRTKISADKLGRRLVKRGIQAATIHGDKAQLERLAALDGFKQGKMQLLVATDIAARGLDIVELPCVVNYELPYSPEDYVHRIGRTGRAGASGLAVSLVSHEEERLLSGIERFIKRDLKVTPLPEPAQLQLAVPPVTLVSPAPGPGVPTRFGRRRAEPVCALLMPPSAGTHQSDSSTAQP